MWSVGVVAYVLFCGYPPFYADGEGALIGKVLAADFQMEGDVWDKVSEDAKRFVQALLVLNPETRLTANQALSHPFFGPTMVKAARAGKD
jgi:calcium/calmodulin-dependent protein kinase I